MAGIRLNNIKACVFDAYGTLFDVHAPVGRVAGRLGEKAAPLSDTWRLKQLQYTWLRSLMGVHADFWQLTGEALEFAMDAHGIDDPELQHELMELYRKLDAYPDAAPALKTLQQGGLNTAILSNGSPDMLDAAITSAGLDSLLDRSFSVEDIGIYKPDPRVYALVTEGFDIEPQEVCFVSTNGWDASGAAYFGFQVVWLNRFNMVQERLPGKLKAIIPGLEVLPGMIGN